MAATGTVSGYRFAAHTDDAGEPVWFKASQLDKKLAWRQLSRVLEPLPQVRGEREFTRQHDVELERTAREARVSRMSAQWAETGYPPVEQVGAAASELFAAQRAVSSAGRLGRGRAQHRFDRLAATHSERLGVPVTGADGRQRSYAAIRDDVLHARHGDQLAQRDHWAQTAVTASSQLAVWEKIQTDNPDYGAHGPRAVQLAMRMFQRETPQERAYRDYLAHQEQRNRIHR